MASWFKRLGQHIDLDENMEPPGLGWSVSRPPCLSLPNQLDLGVMSTWPRQFLSKGPGFEAELIDRYSRRLFALARQQLPLCVRQRVDPEDVVQSVYRSFFRRLEAGSFSFKEAQDIWRLLAAMTFYKARNAVKFHLRECRDARRERPLRTDGDAKQGYDVPDLEPRAADLEWLFESLEKLLTGLPDTHREIVIGRLQGDTIEQIAQRVHRTRQTVIRVLQRVQEIAARLVEHSG